MGIIFILIPLALLFSFLSLLAFRWCVRTGQYDEGESPGIRVVIDGD